MKYIKTHTTTRSGKIAIVITCLYYGVIGSVKANVCDITGFTQVCLLALDPILCDSFLLKSKAMHTKYIYPLLEEGGFSLLFTTVQFVAATDWYLNDYMALATTTNAV